MDEDGFDGILRRFVVGGPKPATFNDGNWLYGIAVTSFEEYILNTVFVF